MNDSFLNSANAPYVAELYFKYTQNPKSIDDSWKSFFSSLNEDELSVISDFGGQSGRNEIRMLLMIFHLIKLFAHRQV